MIFRDLAMVFGAAVVGGALARIAGQPLVLGYVLGGLIIGPFTPGPAVSDVHAFEVMAEVGVVLLMFSVGIEFSLRDLLRVRAVALLGAPLGIAACGGLGVLVGRLLGWSIVEGLVIGLVLSVASTMVLARVLLDRGELHSRHGRIMMGTLLIEDLAVVVLIVLLPALGSLEPGRLVAIALALGRAALVLVPFALLAWKIVPPVMERVARLHSDELFLLVALAIGVGLAALAQAAGLSLALGAFLAGLLISESDHAHETLARLLSLRDAFGALFFVTVGALIDPRELLANAPVLAAIVGMVVVGKLAIRATLVRLFGERLSTALLVAAGMAQIGEFSFVLVQVARAAGHVSADIYNAVLAASLITLLLNALIVRWMPTWIARLQAVGGGAERRAAAAVSPESLSGHVVLLGFGRVGSAVGEALEAFGIPFAVVEVDPEVVRGLRSRGVPCVLGDAARPGVLERVSASRAALAVVALPEIERAHRAVGHLRALNPDMPVLARAQHPSGLEGLRRAGATEVIQPETEAAATLIRHSLRELGQPAEQTLAYLSRLRVALDPVGAAAAPGADDTRPGVAIPAGALPVVREVAVGAGPLADRSLGEARIREQFGVTVLAVHRAHAEPVLNPSADTVLRAGDRMRAFGLPGQLDALAAAADGRAEDPPDR